MAKYLWREEFCIGHPEIDRQHQQLFTLLDNLYDAVCNGDDAEAQANVDTVVSQLVSYTRNHFYQEEAIMREAGYFGLEQHQQEHERLLGMVDEKMAVLRRGDRLMRIDLLEFMNAWLTQHVLKSDRRLAQLQR